MRRLVLFAHYDGQNRVKPYVLHLLEQLGEACSEIHFVSTSELSASELRKVEACCTRAETKENQGFDFSMWQHALGSVELSAWDELVLLNSSVFGPVRPLAPIFDKMSEAPCDFWSMTDSFEIAWHLQSYFLVFKRSAWLSPAFHRFFASVLPYKNKEQLIRSYEVGLTTFLTEAGLKGLALVPVGSWVHDGASRARLERKRRNPTSYYPCELLHAGMPLVKVELLRDNPARIPLHPVLEGMRGSGYDLSLIEFDRPALKPLSFLARLRGESPLLARARALE